METMTQEMEQLIGKVIGDMGGAANAALVIVGDRLGLFRALAEIGPATPEELSEHTGTNERMVREWLAAQTASEYVTYDAMTERFSMTPEQAMLFADENSPVYMAGGFYSVASVLESEMRLTDAFRTGKGLAWGDHSECLFCGTEKFFRPSYDAHLVNEWLPAMDDMVPRLEAGATVADIGCGHGCSTLIMARAFPNSTFVGFDYHAPSVEHANAAAKAEGLANVRFEVATAQDFPKIDDAGYDLVAVFDALHDMGDPVGAARCVRANLKPDGAWMIIEPAAGNHMTDNMHTVGRVFYAFSATVCVPNAMSQFNGDGAANDHVALGAQAGPKALQDVVARGGFKHFRIATQTPFNLIIDARP